MIVNPIMTVRLEAQTHRWRYRRRRFWALAVSTLFVSAAIVVAPTVPDSANAYSVTGCKFATSVIPMSSPPQPAGYPTISARADWTVNTDIDYFNPSTATVRIDLAYGYYGATGWSGITKFVGCAGTGGVHNNTVIVQINRSVTDSYVTNARQSVISHEIGHAIGLGHVGSNTGVCPPTTLMNPYDSFRWFTCGIYETRADDRTGANTLY